MENKLDETQIPTLMDRFIYLNQLRVGVTTVLLALVAAALGFGGQDPHIQVWVTPSLLVLGVLLYFFDARCRARSCKTAQGIRARVMGLPEVSLRKSLGAKELITEDFLFSLIPMILNSVLSGLSLRLLLGLGTASAASIGALVLVAQAYVYLKLVLRWARMMDEWPDDSLLVSQSDRQDGAGPEDSDQSAG